MILGLKQSQKHAKFLKMVLTWHFQLVTVSMFCAFLPIRQLSWDHKYLYLKICFALFTVNCLFEGVNGQKPWKIQNFEKKLKICATHEIHRFRFFLGLTIFLGQHIREVTANSSSDPWGEKKVAYGHSKVRKTAKIDHPSFGASWRLKGAKKKEKKRSTFLFMIHPNI